MPHIQITLLEGRTPEQKRRIVERITNTMVEEGGTAREAVSIAFVDVSRASFAQGGVLALDKGKNQPDQPKAEPKSGKKS
jgi:4-oxalocrotonate tautomerase